MDLVKAWAVALVTYVLASVVFFWVLLSAVTDPGQLTTGAGRYLWSLIPSLLVYLLTTLLAAIFHGGKHSAGRHALAVLAVPAVGLVITVVGSLADGAVIGGTLLSALVSVVGMVGGRQLVDRIRDGSQRGEEGTYW